MTRREAIAAGLSPLAAQAQNAKPKATKIVRFERSGRTSFGILSEAGDSIAPIVGDNIFQENYATSRIFLPTSAVKLLCPIAPPKIIAVGRNYRSHAGENVPKRPEMFYKPTSCLQSSGEPIILPGDSGNVHFEGELVVVVGKRLKNASVEEAKAAILGVTCGNDVSERDWQNGSDKDMQWWRAKGADTFGPLGPALVKGLDYSNLMLTTRLNGQVKQQQSTKDLIFDCPTCLSFISKYVTLEPGDAVYTGTPGATAKMKAGDVVEVEIEGVGILKNPVKAA